MFSLIGEEFFFVRKVTFYSSNFVRKYFYLYLSTTYFFATVYLILASLSSFCQKLSKLAEI